VAPEQWIGRVELWELQRVPAPEAWTDAALDDIVGN
jgi:hypothetical protein